MTKARDLADLIAAGNPLADGAISVAEISDLTATAAELNKLDGVTASTAELNKLAGLTSSTADLNNVSGINTSVQTQLDGKQDVVANVSGTEIGYLDGVTSAIQTQIDAKAALNNPTFTSGVTSPQVDITAQGDLRLQDSSGGQHIALQAPATIASSYTLTMPTADGSADDFLKTDGSGNLSFGSVSAGSMTLITSGTIGTNSSYSFTLGSNWWNTYKFVRVIWPATYQSGDPPTGTTSPFFRVNNLSLAYGYEGSGMRGNSTFQYSSSSYGKFADTTPQDNKKQYITADIYTDGTYTYIFSKSGSEQLNGSGHCNTFALTTPPSFQIHQPYTGSQKYRHEGVISFYGVK